MTTAGATTVGERIAGRQASRPRALLTSMLAGALVTTIAYRWLRSGDSG
jgi:hypothetical protein